MVVSERMYEVQAMDKVPSSAEEGWLCDFKKMERSHRNQRRRGGVGQANCIELDQHHPVRSNKVASQYFLDVAATPPQLRRGLSHDLESLDFRYTHR